MNRRDATDPAQRCYEAFVAAIAPAVALTSVNLIRDPSIDHEAMISGLGSAHLHGVASVIVATAKASGRNPQVLTASLVASLHEHIAVVFAEEAAA